MFWKVSGLVTGVENKGVSSDGRHIPDRFWRLYSVCWRSATSDVARCRRRV